VRLVLEWIEDEEREGTEEYGLEEEQRIVD